jgi:predicted methyltransferase
VISALRTLLVLFPVFLTTGCGSLAKLDYAGLLTGGRDGWQRPADVIETLALAPGDRVAEIGAGDGYWLPWLSEAVGPAGVVYAVEVEDSKVRELEAKVRKQSLANVVVVLGEYADPKLPDGEIDLAMTCLTYHHIEDREVYFARLRTDLAPGGRVAHLDDHADVPLPIRWMQGNHVSDPAAIVAEMATAGYERTGAWDFLPFMSFQQFAPDDAPRPAE